MTGGRRSGAGRSRRVSDRSQAEWVTFAVASAVLALVMGAIVSLWLGGPPSPPSFDVRTFSAREVGGRFHVRTSVENSGEETAESVQVGARLTAGGEPPEEAEQTIDFLSGGEEEEVEFIFGSDPAQGELEVQVISFKAR